MTESSSSPDRIRIFIGTLVQNKSEHDCLRTVYEILAKSSSWAYVFVNFHAAGRQIDLAVFTEKTTLVIEAKGYLLPIRGTVNGLWEQIGPYGSRKIGNAYNQALDAKNALRDEMQRLCQVSGYPNGAVLSVPAIPKGSVLTSGDFKVSVAGLVEIEQLLSQPSGALLTQESCEIFAKWLSLDLVGSIDAALYEDVFVAKNSCDAYLRAFNEFYGPAAAELIADQYKCGELAIESSEVRSMVGDGATGLLIRGPAGCGKSLLTTSCAVSCLANGCLPIFVSAKNFEGEFLRLLDREVVLLNAPSASSIINISRRLGKRIVLFLDGYNECDEDLKTNLTRSLKVFARRYGAGIVVSTQQDLVRSDLLSMKTVHVDLPTMGLKVQLAEIGEQDDPSGSVQRLLEVANSGLEANLVGQVGAFLPLGASRFELFDTYARRKLKDAAGKGVRVLSEFAETLVQRACFSISVREFDRLCDASHVDDNVRQQVMQSKLLQTRGDRISFAHELFFSAFAAEAAIRTSNRKQEHLLSTLASPRYFSSKVFVLGAIEDDRILHDVLENIADPDLLAACTHGECGATAQAAVKRMIENVMVDMLAELDTVRFHYSGEEWNGVAVNEGSLYPGLRIRFDRLLSAIGQEVLDGRHLDVVMSACRKMDDAIAAFLEEFAAETNAKKVQLRTAVFYAAYVIDRKAAISKLVNYAQSGFMSFRREVGADYDSALQDAWAHAESPGQYFFLLWLTRATSSDRMPAPQIARLLQNIRTYPYHLQLAIIDCAIYARRAEEPYRTEIVEALEGLLGKLGVMMNTFIFEALTAFGSLEEEKQNHIPVIHREIEDALNMEGSDGDVLAWNLYSRQFDHLFDVAYWEEIQGLDESRKKALFTKACRGAEAPYVSFLSLLIRSLAEFNDSETASVIAPWTRLPDKRHFMPQDAIEVFVVAHEALGRLGVELPKYRGEPACAADHALLACAELEYWSNRKDVIDVQTSAHFDTARNVLLNHSASASAGAMLLTTSRILAADRNRVSLVQRYPHLCLAISRRALNRRDEQVTYFEHERPGTVESIACFAIQVLGDAGDIEDLRLLRSLCDSESYGTSSLKAIEKIEGRTRFRHD